MNILYLGPYRQSTTEGITSFFTLLNLIQSNRYNLTSRPIYFKDAPKLDIANGYVAKCESSLLDNYDMVIQHTYIYEALPINSVNKNIIIPITTDETITSQDIDCLSAFDTILVDTKLNYNRLAEYTKIKNKIKTYDYDIPISSLMENKFDIGVLNQTKKLYFIGNYSSNKTNIYNICKSFIANLNYNEYSLVLFLFDMDYNFKNELDSFISRFYEDSGPTHAINRIVVVPIISTFDNMIVAHQTGDIFIDIQDDNSNSFNYKIALLLKKKIIQFNMDDLDFSFDRNGTQSKNGFIGVSQRSLSKSISDTLHNKNQDPLPFKKQNIINLI
jgi:hypothetical protein